MATALTKAKRLYTSKKNSLNRLLDPIPALLRDLSVVPEGLIEARKGCKNAWDQFVLASQSLDEIEPEEDDPDGEEFGALETRKERLMIELGAEITKRSCDRDAQKLHQEKEADEERVRQEKQAELERLHQAKLDKVTSRRLRLANLHEQCNEQLIRLLESLTMEEPPSIDQLVVGESTVIDVRSALRKEQVLALEVADMSPEIAGEVMVTSAAVSNTCKKLETEILVKINKFKSELCPPDPVHTPEASRATKEGSFKLEKRRLP